MGGSLVPHERSRGVLTKYIRNSLLGRECLVLTAIIEPAALVTPNENKKDKGLSSAQKRVINQ